MQNLAQIADELEDFDKLDRCRSCNAPKYVASWTHCGTCDRPFEAVLLREDSAVDLDPLHEHILQEYSAVGSPASALCEESEEEENGGVSEDVLCSVHPPCSDDDDSMIGSMGQDDTPSLRSHLYDSSVYSSKKKKRRSRMPAGQGARSGTERLVERPDLTKPNTTAKTYRPQKRIDGSKPVLVDVDEARASKMKDLARVEGFGDPGSGKEVCMKEFQYLLLHAGYSEGSWKHEDGCEKRCNRKCAGSCRNDGNPHTYPRFMGIFFDCNAVKTKADFFVDGAQARARRVAHAHGTERAHSSKKWNEVDDEGVQVLDDKERAALIMKLSGDVMHGFDDYIDLCNACNNKPASLMPKALSKKKKRPAAPLHDPGSPSLR